MEENVFGSIDEIDEKLDEEFGEVANEPEETTNTEVSEQNADNVSEQGVSNEETQEEQSGETVETPQIDDEGKVDKKEHAFANLRNENSNLKKERDAYKTDSDYLKELAASYGYDDVQKFQDAIREARYQKEAQDKGYDPALYKKTMEQERRIAQLEKEREQEIQERKLERFQIALDNAVKEYGIEAQEIFDKLDNSGLSVETVLNVDNPKILLDGLLIDEIKNNTKQSQIQDLQNLKSLAEDKNETTATVENITIDSLLRDDIAKYKKENFYD